MNIKTLLLTFLLMGAFFSAKTQTVVDIVVNSPDHNTLEAAVIAANLAGTLSGPGPFTLFAPTDEAFANLPDGTLDALLQDPNGALTEILTYHVVGANIASTDIPSFGPVATLEGSTAYAYFLDGIPYIDNAVITVTDIQATNGVVHVIDAVILPSRTTPLDIVINSDSHTTLEAVIVGYGLAPLLYSIEQPYTLFAPDDSAFAAIPVMTLNMLLQDTAQLTTILTAHVSLEDSLSANDILENPVISTPVTELLAKLDNGNVVIEGATVTAANITATTGILHVVDRVIVPNKTGSVMDVVLNSTAHTTLETAILAAGLQNTLDDASQTFTLFAPTDEAFSALPADVLNAALADPNGLLTEVLLYHAVSGDVKAGDLSKGMMVNTLNGTAFIEITADGRVFIDNAEVIVTDIETDNGVVHVIDAVLLPGRTTVADIVIGSDVHNTLETAIDLAQLTGTLSGDGPFTLFAPTDEAFSALPADVLNAALADPNGLLTEVLLYHAVSGDVKASDLSKGMMVNTLNGSAFIEITADGRVFIDNAEVIVTDIETDNGVVHVIDAVLLPGRTTVADIVIGSDVHNTLETAIDLAQLTGTLSGAGPFTLFAPTDDAFAALPADVLNAALADPNGLLTEVLLYHAVSGDVKAGDLSKGMMVNTLNGTAFIEITADGRVFIDNAEVIVTDIETDNGVVHVIDAVLLPGRTTVADIVIGSDVHTILETAIDLAQLTGTLSGDGPFTLFAPTDDAFAALPADVLNAALADPNGLLTEVLLYHAVSGDVKAGDLSKGMMVNTLNGTAFIEITADGRVFIDNAEVIVTDIETDNGVVHVIDAVLLPGRTTVADIVIGSDVHTTLEIAIDLAQLTGTLSGDGPFTLFAPTDDAFAALDAAVLNAALADPNGLLTEVLTYHVVAGEFLSTNLSSGMVPTVNGQTVNIEVGTTIQVNTATVIQADLITDNGVVHVIDGVLLPSPSSSNEIEVNGFSLYPNPTTDEIIISSDVFSGSGSINIMNELGQVLITLPMDGESVQSINVRDLRSGSYYVLISNQNKKYVGTFLKQ